MQINLPASCPRASCPSHEADVQDDGGTVRIVRWAVTVTTERVPAGPQPPIQVWAECEDCALEVDLTP